MACSWSRSALVSFSCLLLLGRAPAAQSPDGIALSASKAPVSEAVTLEWTGGDVPFQVFRSANPATVLDPGSKIAETSDRTWTDLPPPGGVFYYRLTLESGPPATLAPGAPDRMILNGTVVTPTGFFDGEVLVEGNLITCVAPSCSSEPGAAGATVVTTNGIILPGLIDAHNHGLYNIFDESDWTPLRLYTNHNQWTSETRYQETVDAKQYLGGEGGSPVDYRCEMDKYAEIKALIAGTTSFLLAPGTSRICYGSLIRTIDTPQNDLPADKIQTSISVPSESTAQGVCNNFATGKTDAYVVHVSEGVDQTALNEFYTLASRANGCLMSPKTTIVHGTALGAPEFATMAADGMKLVWSPKSNVFLYGDTTRIDLALQAGVQTIALAPDWGLGGSRNLLDELRFADGIDATKFGDILSPARLVEMVTSGAARALAVDGLLGTIEVGKRADLAVIGGHRTDPYGSLLTSAPSGVRLVLVDGRALYGDAGLIAVGPSSPGCETTSICGASKFLCAAETSTSDKLNQTYAQIVDILKAALQDYDANVIVPPVRPFSPIAPLVWCP